MLSATRFKLNAEEVESFMDKFRLWTCKIVSPSFLIETCLCRYGWDDQYYEYDDTGQYEGWVQDEYGEWHQEHHQLNIILGLWVQTLTHNKYSK